jgi:hypothetical protein
MAKAAILLAILAFIPSHGSAQDNPVANRMTSLLCQTIYKIEQPPKWQPIYQTYTTPKFRIDVGTAEDISKLVIAFEMAVKNKTIDQAYIQRFKKLAVAVTGVFTLNALYHLTLAPVNSHFGYIEVTESMSFASAALIYFTTIRNKYADPKFYEWAENVTKVISQILHGDLQEDFAYSYRTSSKTDEVILDFYTLGGVPHLVLEIW